MFVARVNPPTRLPSFSELVLSLTPYPMPPVPMMIPQLVQVPNPLPSPLPHQLLNHSVLLGDEAKPRVLVSPHADLATPPASGDLAALDSPAGSGAAINLTRRHACKTCGRRFTTLGHLARHNRTHTGERKHVCPWPTCEQRFARQDNCMQHYKTHISGKAKRYRMR